MLPTAFDPKTILQSIKGLLALHRVLVEEGYLPDQDIEAMLFPSKVHLPLKPTGMMSPLTQTPTAGTMTTTSTTMATSEIVTTRTEILKRLLRKLENHNLK